MLFVLSDFTIVFLGASVKTANSSLIVTITLLFYVTVKHVLNCP